MPTLALWIKRMSMKKNLILSISIALLALINSANAQIIAGPTTITGNSDVNANGTNVLAFDFHSYTYENSTPALPSTVNGVTFNGNLTQNGVTLTGNFTSFDHYYGGFVSTSALSPELSSVLTGGVYTNTPNPTQTYDFIGLTPGLTYQAQFFAYDDRFTVTHTIETLSTGSASGTLKNGAGGEFNITTFIADSTGEQDFTLTSTGGNELNAISLNVVPEPSAYVLILGGCLTLLLFNRRIVHRIF